MPLAALTLHRSIEERNEKWSETSGTRQKWRRRPQMRRNLPHG